MQLEKHDVSHKKERRGKYTSKYKYGRRDVAPDADEDEVEDAVDEFYAA